MSKTILGLDLGTNSIGWAVVNDNGRGEFDLIKRGVHIFEEGVKIEKGNESSKAAERTGYRAARRLKFRRKLRKIETLKALSDAGFCPPVSKEELKNWQSKKIYPLNPDFRDWFRTSDPKENAESQEYKNPYYFRWLAATENLDLNNREDRYRLGRAFYHMAQRRGFKSNRLDTTKESDGVVSKDICELSEKLNGRTLGQYFFEECYGKRKIRKVHTSREEHYATEFKFICQKQGLADELIKNLYRAIFYQRPLKSQKALVANCPFEPKKKRIPISHPVFEEFRMHQTLNNIKIKTLDDADLRPLTSEEKEKTTPLFFRVSKAHFDFEDIAKKLTPRGQKFACGRDAYAEAHVRFNYREDQTISGCPFSAELKKLFGDDYKAVMFSSYAGNKTAKTADDILYEVWHVLFSFDDENRLRAYAQTRLGLDAEQVEKFVSIHLKQGYGELSFKAINKILPFLKQGLIYSHAVFFANLTAVVGEKAAGEESLKDGIATLIDSHKEHIAIQRCINDFVGEYRLNPLAFENRYNLMDIQSFRNALPVDLQHMAEHICKEIRRQIRNNNDKGEFAKLLRLEERVAEYLKENFGVDEFALKKLYHPSKEETYKPAERAEDGHLYLNSPNISSIRNPVFMRAMHRLKAVVNELVKQGMVNEQTVVHIEMAKELNDANKRIALRRWQKSREDDRKKYKAAIEEVLVGQGITREASDDEILKYQLWEEQKHICPYTGTTIEPSAFIGADPEYDIEHTIPRSLSCDDSQENMTLCDRAYNRETKKNRIPTQCPNYGEIVSCIAHWEDRVVGLEREIEKKLRASRAAQTKDLKDKAIQERLVLQFERNYFREKCRRFTMEEVTSGFKNSQLVDTRIITKYAGLYLKTVFNRVCTVNGKTTNALRKCWGVEKSRDTHAHHAVDAIIAACLTRDQYDELARFYHEYESYESGDRPQKPHFPKPWQQFTEDMKELKEQILVSHYAPNNLLKQTKRNVRLKGRAVVQQGQTARGSLHKDTFYGRIKDSQGEVKTVVRVPLAYSSTGGLFGFKNTDDLKRIVDRNVREKIRSAVAWRLESGNKKISEAFKDPVWMNEEKGIQIKKVRCFADSVKNPIALKKQTNLSRQEHKQDYYVQNDSVFVVAVYEGKNKRGRSVFDMRGLSALEAVSGGTEIPDSVNKNGTPCLLKYKFHAEKSVLFYVNDPKELSAMPIKELSKRLYKVNDLGRTETRTVFRHHMEARAKTDILAKHSLASSLDFSKPAPLARIAHSNTNVLIEGVDFKFNVLGEIGFLERN
jgi:CRISPR-associated endonuclease Csn1